MVFVFVVKLAALIPMWIPQEEVPLLQPVVIRPALAAETPPAAQPTPDAPAAQPAADTNATGEPTLTREQQLDKREADLKALEAEVDAKLKHLNELEAKVQTMLNEAGKVQDEKMLHLIDVYSNMKPKQAAQVLATMDEGIAVKILAGMSGRKAGEVLSSVPSDRAAKLSEALTRLQASKAGQ